MFSFFIFRSSELLYKEYLEKYQCPVCYQYMHPPIRQCVIGHSICSKCHQRKKSCPVCKSQYKEGNHHLMENLHQHLVFPCKYNEKGCKRVVRRSERAMHEANCWFSWQQCPISNFGYCTWLGPEKDAIEHCKEIHPEVHIFEGAEVLYEWNNSLVVKRDDGVDFLIHAFERIFHCNIKCNVDRVLKMYLSMYSIPAEEDNMFGYYDILPLVENPFILKVFDFRTQAICGPLTDVAVTTRNNITMHSSESEEFLGNCCVSCVIRLEKHDG